MNSQQTVGQLVTERPSRSRVFAKHGIDFCCGGGRSLSDACSAKGLEVDALIAELEAAEAPAEGAQNFGEMTLTALTEHLVSTHHAYLKSELPRLRDMVHKVARVHGDKDARLGQLVPVFDAFFMDMLPHLDKEEMILFPTIRDMEAGRDGGQCFSHISAPISVMESEHDHVGHLLVKMRELCADYVIPEAACNTWRAMLDGLHELETDTHQHVHLENNILHTRALKLADA